VDTLHTLMNDVDFCRILRVAQTFDDRNVTFAMSSVDEFEHELAEHDLTVDPAQPAVIARDSANRSYVMTEDFS